LCVVLLSSGHCRQREGRLRGGDRGVEGSGGKERRAEEKRREAAELMKL